MTLGDPINSIPAAAKPMVILLSITISFSHSGKIP
jgi:hypothetical protein